MIILVTGSVATGKTSISNALSKKLKLESIDLNKLVKENKLYSGYNKKFDSYEVDTKKLNKFLIKFIKNKNLILDSHLSHYLPSKYADYCVVCKCDLKELKIRLMKRKYSKIKVRENLDSEIFDACLIEALENRHNVIVVDTSKKNVNKCVDEIIKKLSTKSSLS